MNRPPSPARFRAPRAFYHADTCEPLVAAATRGELRLDALARGSYPGLPLPPRDAREVCSVGAWDARAEQRWGLDWHRNEGIELTFLSAGHLPFAVDRQSFTLSPGHFTLTRPWQRHRVGAPHVTPSRLIWLILDVGVRRPNQAWRWPPWVLLEPPVLRTLTERLRHHEEPVWRATPELARAFERLASLCQNPEAGAITSRLKVVTNEILLAVSDLMASRRLRLDESLASSERTVRLFLEEELPVRADEPWTLDSMAAQCGIGRTRFSHLCRQQTNRTPIEHLTRCRLDLACRLLRERPGSRITDVAFAAGFQTSQYFATVFARRFGVSPSAWREQGR